MTVLQPTASTSSQGHPTSTRADTSCSSDRCKIQNQIRNSNLAGCHPVGSSVCGRSVCGPDEQCMGGDRCCKRGAQLCGVTCCDLSVSTCLNNQCVPAGSSLCNGLICERRRCGSWWFISRRMAKNGLVGSMHACKCPIMRVLAYKRRSCEGWYNYGAHAAFRSLQSCCCRRAASCSFIELRHVKMHHDAF